MRKGFGRGGGREVLRVGLSFLHSPCYKYKGRWFFVNDLNPIQKESNVKRKAKEEAYRSL